MSKKELVVKTVMSILNYFPLIVDWDVGTKCWQLLVPGTVAPNSYQGFMFSLTATIFSLSTVRKVILLCIIWSILNCLKHQDLIISRTLQTGMKYLAFDSAANAVAGRFSMACCKKCPCCMNVRTWLVVVKIEERPYNSCTAQHNRH